MDLPITITLILVLLYTAPLSVCLPIPIFSPDVFEYLCRIGHLSSATCTYGNNFFKEPGDSPAVTFDDLLDKNTTFQDSASQDSAFQDSTFQDSTFQDSTSQDSTSQDSTFQDLSFQDLSFQVATCADSSDHETPTQQSLVSGSSNRIKVRTGPPEALPEAPPIDTASENSRETSKTDSPFLLLLAASLLANVVMAAKSRLSSSADDAMAAKSRLSSSADDAMAAKSSLSSSADDAMAAKSRLSSSADDAMAEKSSLFSIADDAMAAAIGRAIGVTVVRLGSLPSTSSDKISRVLMQATSLALPPVMKNSEQCSAFCSQLLSGFSEICFPEPKANLPARRSSTAKSKKHKGHHGSSRANRNKTASGRKSKSAVPGGDRASHSPAESASSTPEPTNSWPGYSEPSSPQVVPEDINPPPAVWSFSSHRPPLRACTVGGTSQVLPAADSLQMEAFSMSSAAKSDGRDLMMVEHRSPSVMAYGGVHGVDAYSPAASLTGVMCDLLATSQMVMMRQCEVQERQVAIAYRQAELAEQRVRQGEAKMSMKERRERGEREEKLKGEFAQSMADFLMAGMAAMMATLALTVYHLAPTNLWAKMDECMATHQKAAPSLVLSVLGLASWMDSLADGFHWLACSMAVLSSFAVAFVVVAAMAAIFVRRDALEYHRRPIFRIFVLLIVMCGGLGFFAMQGMGGHGLTWLAFWEMLCGIHFMASLCRESVWGFFYTPAASSAHECSEAVAEETKVRPFRMAALFSAIGIVLPVAAGVIPFLVNS